MALSALRLEYTFEEYVRFERDAASKHEYVGGAILAMAGGTLEHGARCATIVGILLAQLAGRRCRVFDSNARVRVAATGNAYYPDASVVCGSLEVDPLDTASMLNPSVLVEVLSPSTAAYDTQEKFDDYVRIHSLLHVVHVHHDTKRIDVHTRRGEKFERTTSLAGETALLILSDLTLDVDEVYFDPLAPASNASR